MADTIDRIIEREGGYTHDPADPGGRYEAKYLTGPGFDKITVPYLREQLVDFGVNSGPSIAIVKLQGILGVKQDGILGTKTLDALSTIPPMVVNNRLAVERIKLMGRIVSKHPTQLKFLNGWLDRAAQFIV